MNYYQHLKRINNLQSKGRRAVFIKRLVCYNLRYFLMRPTVARLFLSGRFQQEQKLFYTVLTGNYDQLPELPEKLKNWEYICFTDNPQLTSSTWRIEQIENRRNLDPGRLSRLYKIKNYLVDGDYDLSLYVDANIRIRGNLDAFLSQALTPHGNFSILLHPFLNSLAEEYEQCLATGKDQSELLRQQYEYYTRKQGFTDYLPHINARMLIRRSGIPAISRLMDFWFEQLLTWSKRDQISFNYALSINPTVSVDYVPYWLFRRYFKRLDHR